MSDPVHITIHNKPLPSHDEVVTRLRHVAWLAEEGSEVVDIAAAAAERISTLEALTDQLAEALRRRTSTAWPSDE